METYNLDQMISKTVRKYIKKPLIVAGNWKMNINGLRGLDFIEKWACGR